LAQKGVKGDVRAVIVCEDPQRSAQAFLACMILGTVPAQSAPRTMGRRADSQTARAVALSDAAYVLTDDDGLSCPAGVELIRLDNLDVAGAEPAAIVPNDPAATCYGQFSSGSTGQPKLIEVDSLRLCANLAALSERFNHDPRHDRWLGLSCAYVEDPQNHKRKASSYRNGRVF